MNRQRQDRVMIMSMLGHCRDGPVVLARMQDDQDQAWLGDPERRPIRLTDAPHIDVDKLQALRTMH